jgi:hypothetical protein
MAVPAHHMALYLAGGSTPPLKPFLSEKPCLFLLTGGSREHSGCGVDKITAEMTRHAKQRQSSQPRRREHGCEVAARGHCQASRPLKKMVYRGGRGSHLDDECASPFSDD